MGNEYYFGTLLHELRVEKGFRQADLAKMLSLSQDTISLWERNKSLPDFNSIKSLSIIFGVTSDYLLGLTEY